MDVKVFFLRGKMDVKVNHEKAIVRPSLFILVPKGIRSKFKTTHHSGL
jgi:mannose-6-phosphate isomerase-like protein (cupin superfamily)